MALKKVIKSVLNVKYIKIKNIEINNEELSLNIHVEATKGHQCRCPICKQKSVGYDQIHTERKWRSLDLGGWKVYLVSPVKRITCPEHGIITEDVPWAYHNSRFTKDFEEYIAYLSCHLSKKDTSRIARIAWNTVGPVLSRTKNRLEPDSTIRFNGVTRIGIDETSYRKGHKYVTVVTDHDTNQVIWVGKGTGKEVLESFFKLMSKEQREAITLVSADGAKWIKSSIEEWLPNATRCLDGYHVVTWAMDAMDELRKQVWREAKTSDKAQPKHRRGRPSKGEVRSASNTRADVGKAAKYALGKNPENLTDRQQTCLDEIREKYPRMFRGYQLKEGLRKVFQSTPENVEYDLNCWLSWACRSKLPPFVELSKKIRRHKEAIIATVVHGLSNARIESTNNKIKLIIRKSYGFRNIENMKDMIMIVCSKLMTVSRKMCK